MAEVQSRWQGQVEAKLDVVIDKLDGIDETLHGNGREGLVVKVDRNDQSLATLRKVFFTVLTAGLALAGGVLLALII